METQVTESAPRADERETPASLWANRDFLWLWAGETVSLFGSEVTRLALSLVAVIVLHATPAEAGVLNAAKFLPFLLLSLPAGVWIDRFPRRPILIAANLGSALALGSVPVLAATGHLRMGHLDVIAFVAGAFAVFLHVGFWSYVPSLVRPRHLLEANSRLFTSSSAAAVGGPGLGGVLIQWLTAPGALIIDAASFVAAAASLFSIRQREVPIERGPSRALRTEVREGLQFVLGNPYLRAFAGEAATFNLFFNMMMTVFLIYAVRVLQVGAGVLGAVIAFGAVGMLLGSLIARRVERRLKLGPAVNAVMMLGNWPYLLVPLAAGTGTPSMIAPAIAFFTAGVGIGVTVVLVGTLRQTITPPGMMGRMNASYRFVVWGSITVGALLGGALGSAIGLRPTLVIAALGIATCPAWIFLSPIGALQSAEDAKTVP